MVSTLRLNPSYMSIRKHMLIASVFLGLELWFGIGLLAGAAAIMSVVKLCGLLSYRAPRKLGLQVAATYMFVFAAIMWWINLNWKLAERHAEPVIGACESYRTKKRIYPESLEALVPEFLPAVPQAGLTHASRRFGYSARQPKLYFAVMFHGVASYDFERHAWTTND